MIPRQPKPYFLPFDWLRANGADENIADFPFMLSPSKHENDKSKHKNFCSALLAFCRNLSRHLQDRFAGKDLIDLSGPLSPDDPLSVDEEEISLRCRHVPLGVQAPVAPNHFKVRKIT